ncbi:MAG: DNA polymerase III subunit gamma/tau [Candidatus Competibacteraceae bacterium]|nr:DNA polymerase III subunit gamma/tau [Candidatus Competibacteraceae bacterium]
MSYQVLARKWRPRTFQEVVGQEHVVRALTNALDQQRLHHAFLFTGTRGVGKTTLARILAKALNCEQGVSASPCGQCGACREIDEGRFVDLLEVDAASRTGVDDTRELLDNVPYAPARGRYKVYLIDEVHMFSKSSFNALLKTLEEPPPHVKFLLATTDPQRLPVTVLSRCLQFNLKSLSTKLIAQHLAHVLTQDNIPHEAAALNLLARAGDGSLRDALSVLDQAIAFGSGQVNEQDVSMLLGTIDHGQVLKLVKALAHADADELLKVALELEQTAPDYLAVLAELLSLLQHLALVQAIPETAIDTERFDTQAVQQLAKLIAPEDIQLFYQIALLGRRDLPLAPEPKGGFEMILLRMLCFRPQNTPPAARQKTEQVLEHAEQTDASPTPASSESSIQSSPVVTEPRAAADWNDLVNALDLKGMAQQLALNCSLRSYQNNSLHLILAPGYAQTKTKNAEDRLRTALESHIGKPVKLQIQVGESTVATPAERHTQHQAERQQAAWTTLNQDPNVQALRETFEAQVRPDSISLDDD